ncbi:MarR family winged helix-turn-helix transcriptional regulator [Melioribacteraceae bacterium 4301-Me]|uniref:MarR family winged helix-turn-helix transcriptional regulator n=1 Tax=Pyranulibacter aquaticus TaxID=3163344 RepID=UPI003596E72E
MNSINEEELLSQAEKMAELTCEISKKCADKEKHFANLINLTPAEFKCLRLFTFKNEMPVKEIASNLQITQGRVTHIITSLESKELIKRRVNDADKRNVIVYLTEKSRPFLASVDKKYIQLHKEILQQIEPGKRNVVLETLSIVISALDSWLQKEQSLENLTL